ncbi:MAG: HDOD domain-containing protein [Pyrinomonadaceae bacterium]
MTTYQIEVRRSRPTEEELISIESFVKAKLMPLPSSASRVLGLIENPNVTTGELSTAIGLDPVLASRVMRLANSPMYAMEREIATVSAAVAAVGVRSIYDIVMLGVAADNFSRDMRSLKTGVTIWEHSAAVALACKGIAKQLRMRGAEEAFTCGLLHDIGKNLLFLSDPIRYTEVDVLDNEESASEMERQIFGFDHSQVGFYVARRWGLAEAVSAAVLWHHVPREAEQAVVICHVVNVADELVTRKGMGLHIMDSTVLPSSYSVKALGLEPLQMERAWEETEISLATMLDGF